MTWSVSGNVITNSAGAAVNLLALSGLHSGITVVTGNQITTITGSAVRIVNNGTLTVSPKTNSLVMEANCGAKCFENNGTLTVGTVLVVNGEDVTDTGQWLTIKGNTASPWIADLSGFFMTPTSVNNFNGGSIVSALSVTIDGTVNTVKDGLRINLLNDARALPLGGSLSNMTFGGNGFKLLGALDETPNNLKLINATVLGVMVQTGFGYPEVLPLEGYNAIGQGALTTVGDGATIAPNNSVKGTATQVIHNAAGVNHKVPFTQDIRVLVKDLNKAAVGGELRISDTNNGSRVNISGPYPENYTNSRETNTTIDATGIKTVNILLGVSYRSASDVVGLDYRSVSGNAADDFTISFREYGFKINRAVYGVRSGFVKDIEITAQPDALATATKAATIALATQDNAYEAYDKVVMDQSITYANEADWLVSRSGNTFIVSTFNVVASGTATFGRTASAITLKSATFAGSITTTGSVSLAAIGEGQTITSSQNVTLATLPTALTLDNAILNLPAGADVTDYVETNGGSYKATADGTYTARGKASSIIAANGFNITVVTAAAPTPSTLNFTANSARWAIYNNSGTFIESGTGDKTLNHSAGVDAGTWKIISHRKGYVAQINTWSADDGTTNAIAFAGTQIVRPEGGVAYTTATTPNTTISISASRVHTLIGNLSISTQELVNVQQNFLNTDAGLAWIEDTSTTAAPTHGNLGGTAFFLNLTGFTYDSTTGSTPESAVNATLVSSATHANVVTTNGGTIFGGGSASAADIAALVWASSNQSAFNTLASSLATRVDVQSVEQQMTVD